MPEDIPESFKVGDLLSAAALNRLQKAILERLAAHDHSGGAQGLPIGTPGLADGAVSAAKLGDGAVSTRALAQGAVGAAQIAAQAVGTAALEDASVTEEKLSADVRALLNRLGSGASSASQVIWRDPVTVYPSAGDVGIVEGIINAADWSWPIGVVTIGEENVPIRFNPKTEPGNIFEVIDFGISQPANVAILETQLNWALEDAADNILSVGAAGVPGGMMVAGGPQVFGEMQPPGGEVRMMRSMAMTDARGETGAQGTNGARGIAPTSGARAAAARMTTIANVDAAGRPVDAGSPDAITVSAGFSGQDTFTRGGSGSGRIDYRALGGANAGAKKDAAEAAGQMLFNLGLDSEYGQMADLSQAVRAHLDLAYTGEIEFFDPGKPLWQGTSWLPDILNRPELFGTGYALSGGRNIASVTRQFAPGNIADTWVRVRFITPYRNSAYAVSVTPRVSGAYAMVSAAIRAKAAAHVDIEFTGAAARDGGQVRFERISKLSFDLAIFGDLGQAA